MNLFIEGLIAVLQPMRLLILIISLSSGIIIGAIPGLSPLIAIALMLPVAYSLGPSTGLIMLGAIWVGGVYGGGNAAILINVPGTPAAIATTFDGYPMTKKGKADEALHACLLASVIGGLIGAFTLLLLFGPLARLSVRIGPPEFFWLSILGLTTIGGISGDNLKKGLLAGAIGVLISTIGLDPAIGLPRFTFGYSPLMTGVGLVPAILGLFSLGQSLLILESKDKFIAEYSPTKGVMKSLIPQFLRQKVNIIRSSAIGIIIGMLPGSGSSISTLLSYNEARRWSDNPEKFGEGCIDGIIASEACNNATISGCLVPMMGLGIPGNVVSAVLMGALLTFGIQPGMNLLVESGDVAYTFMASLVISNLLMLVVGYILIRITVRFLLVPTSFMAPTIIGLAVIGSYTASRSMYGVGLMLIIGVIGFLFLKAGIARGPIALGLVLGRICEQGFTRSLSLSRASSIPRVFFLRPISLVLIIVTILAVYSTMKIKKKEEKLN